MSKLFSAVLITVFMAGVLAGCGGELEETYRVVTLREASHEEIASPGFKFGFDSPEFVAASGDIALVREGNLVEFFTGQDIESKLEMVEGRNYLVGARKIYSPMVHYTVDFMVAGGDTIEVGEPYAVDFPPVIGGFDVSDYEDIDLSGISSSTRDLDPIFNTRFLIEPADEAKVSREMVVWTGDSMMVWLLDLGNVKFFIEQVENPAIETVLKAYNNEMIYFDGGVSYGDRPPTGTRSYRARTDIAGPVELHFVRYGGKALPVTE